MKRSEGFIEFLDSVFISFRLRWWLLFWMHIPHL